MPDWKALLEQPRRPVVITQQLITARAKELLYEVDEKSGISNLTRIAQAWIEEAAKGNVVALNSLLDRTEGRVPQVNENHNHNYRAEELSDDELAGIIARGRSILISATPGDPQKPN